MTPLQFSLRNLLLGIAFVAVGCAALLNAGPWSLALVWWLTIALLVAAILLAVYRRQERRAFWLGLAVVGWCYVLAGSDDARQLPQRVTTWAYQRLPDSRRESNLAWLPQNLPAVVYTSPSTMTPQPYDSSTPAAGGTPAIAYTPTYVTSPPASVPNPAYIPQNEFISIGEALWLLLFAYVGGVFARWLYRSEQARAAAPDPP